MVKNIVRLFIIVAFVITLCSCSSYWNIGESSFSCPHKRPSGQFRCMPASVIERLDEMGKFDWRWYPICPEKDKEGRKECEKLLRELYGKEKPKKLIMEGIVVPESF